ncbi:CaiB/BaiF CoA transferase family protein [Orrella sp. 11846]|uniref:CaiB/BaiF CoA transferase family protein n=1 Tax=Orrella sp. 11846 TaxID=3409913 RepID=UPI003B5CB419
MTTPKPPLHDVVVIDFTELLPGPFMTQMLSDMGARVIKIERPPHGDPVRKAAPGLFAAINRNKESLFVDLKTDAGLQQVMALILEADVLVESYRPGTLSRLGLGYDKLKDIHPKLIYVSLSGYGQSGPDAMMPGHDLNYLSAAGVAALTTSDQPVHHPQSEFATVPASQSALPYADMGGALYGLNAVLAALFQRQSSAQGQWLDVSLTEAVLHQMTARLAVFQQNKTLSLAQQQASLERPAYGCYECQDGMFVSIGALESHFFERLVSALHLSEFQGDPWKDGLYRKQHAARINKILGQCLLQMPSQQVIDILRNHDVPVMEVVLPTDLPKHPQHIAREMFMSVSSLELPKFPIRLRGMNRSGG